MKNLLILLSLGIMLLSSCSSSSRLGYEHYDDVYNTRPTYSEKKRNSNTAYNSSNYQEPSYTQNNSEYQDNRYVDDQQSRVYGDYTDRIRRFHGGSSGFDYYSPYYTGFNDGFSYGIGMGSTFGYPSYHRWNSFYRPSFHFGWSRYPFYLGYNNWYSPYSYYGWSDPYRYPYHGWGNHYFYPYDKYPKSNKQYYAPRPGNYGNQYYNGPRNSFPGGKTNINRGSDYGTPQNDRNSGGNMRVTPKNNNTRVAPSATPPPVSPRMNQQQRPSREVPNRYQRAEPSQPSNIKTAPNKTSPGGKSGGTIQQREVPQRYSPSNSSPRGRSSPSFSSPSRSSGKGNVGGSRLGGSRSGGSMNRTNK